MANATSTGQALLILMANILVTWAASYGIDEQGNEDADVHAGEPLPTTPVDSFFPQKGTDIASSMRKKRRRARCNDMVREMLAGVDNLALLRRPSWDGVRVLMLLMPLTEGLFLQVSKIVPSLHLSLF